MGCDIHAHVEYRYPNQREDDAGWFHAASVNINRWYSLFGAMAGVRREDVKPVAPPRGFPGDAAWAAREEYEETNGDAHTPSWLTPSEFRQAVERVSGGDPDDAEPDVPAGRSTDRVASCPAPTETRPACGQHRR